MRSLSPNPPIVANRLLLDMHTRQHMCTAWTCVKSEFLAAENGVKQGVILSPILLLCVHCWIVQSPHLFWHRMPYGSFIWCMFWIRWRCQLTCAICRCFRTICENFAKECHVIFNDERKTFCMYVGGNGTAPRRFVTMNDEPIIWKSQIRHLNLITHDLSDRYDITYNKVSSFIKLTDWTQDFP